MIVKPEQTKNNKPTLIPTHILQQNIKRQKLITLFYGRGRPIYNFTVDRQYTFGKKINA